MAQSISLWGATYSNVPAVNLPKSTSGTARFTDTTPTTATASDVASGKVFFLADGSQATGTLSCGDNLEYGITDGTIPKVGIAKVGQAEL